MLDRANDIYETILGLLEDESRTDGLFDGFKIYRDEPTRKGLMFPCIMLLKEDINDNETFFSDEGTRVLQLDLHLAFASRDAFHREGAETFDAEKMVYRYISRLDTFYDSIDLSGEFNIERMSRRVEPVFPLNPKTEQYGCVYSIAINYER